jgi:hypothetical protein
METMNINSAFRLRNRLKEKIQHLNNLIKNATYEKEEDAEEKGVELDGMILKEALAKAIALMDLLCDFNKAIETANEINRADLVALESIRAKIALYEQITAKCRVCKGFEHQYKEVASGIYKEVKIIKHPLLDQSAMVKELDIFRKEKTSLEEKLSRSNYAAKVNFDVEKIITVL